MNCLDFMDISYENVKLLDEVNIIELTFAEDTSEEVEQTSKKEDGLLSPSQLGGYASTALFVLINLIIAFLFLKFLVFKPIMKLLNDRESKIKSDLDEASNANKEASKVLEENKSHIDRAHADAAEIIEEAKSGATKQAELIISKANSEASGIISHAQEEAERMKKVALEEMKEEISDISLSIAKKVIGDAITEKRLAEINDIRTTEVINSRGE